MNLSAFVASRLDKRLNKRLDRRGFDARQLRRFRSLAQFSKSKSPYYARIMEQRRIDPARCHPEDFPELTKADIIKYFDDIITVPAITKRDVAAFLAQSHDPTDQFHGRYIVVHSSGTTGESGYFVYSV